MAGKKKILIIVAVLAIGSIGILSFFKFRNALGDFYLLYMYNRYPLKYDYEIVYNSGQYNLDPSLVSAVIYEESRFDPHAVSDRDAIGLMQILPDTASYISSKIQDSSLDSKLSGMLQFPETNIRYGCFYLSYLFDKYENWDYVLAAYNAGEGNVDNWVKEGDFEVKFEETKNFVERVNKSQDIYKKLYFGG